MPYVLIDESGDLGFNFKKKGTSRFFVVTMLFASDLKVVHRIVKKVHRDLWHIDKKLKGVLHAANERPLTRKKLLKKLSASDCKVMAIILNKQKVFTKLQNEKPVLYNYVANILLDRLMKKQVKGGRAITIIASKRETNKFLNQNFRSYLKQQVNRRHKISIEVLIKTPYEEKTLQVVDFASWAVFRKHEHGDSLYSNLIAGITEESTLFK